MKIAQISNVWLRTPPAKYGGIEAVVSVLTERLVALGHEVTLFATADSLTSAHLWSYYPTAVENFTLQDEIVHTVKACEYIAQSNFDVIHNHAYTFGPAALSFSATPHLTTFPDIPYSYPLSYFEAFSANNRYVSVSYRQREVIPDLNWIGTVHNAINVADFPFRENKDDYLLFIGNIASWKGAHIAVQVARRLQRRLIIAGPIVEQAYFEQEIAPYLDDSQICYVGEVDFPQKIALYKQGAALLVPISWEEPFGLVMIEALACGTPVLAFARGAAPEILLNHKVGFLVENVDEMADAVKKVGNIAPAECRKHVEQFFDVKQMTERYLALYQKVIEE